MWMATSVYLICDYFFLSIQYSTYPVSRVAYKEIYKKSILYGKGVREIEYSLSITSIALVQVQKAIPRKK